MKHPTLLPHFCDEVAGILRRGKDRNHCVTPFESLDGSGGVSVRVPAAQDPIQAMCFFQPEVIRDKLHKMVRDTAPSESISEPERLQRLADIDTQLLKLEKEEEALIRELEELGIQELRRADADPAVVLGLAA